MDYNGELVFAIDDSNFIETNVGLNFSPTKTINKGDLIALGRKAPQSRWLYIVKFNGEKEYLDELEKLLDLLKENLDCVVNLKNKYEKVSIDIYFRSDFAEIGYSLPAHLLQKLALLECTVNFGILSFGMAITEKPKPI